MRFLATDELFAVSGGSINGQGDPWNCNANQDTTDSCGKIQGRRTRDRCYLEAARSQHCPGGWEETSDGGSATGNGIKGRSTTFTCKADNSNDGGDSDGDDSNDSGND